MILAALALSAHAADGTIHIEKGGLIPVFAWVDGTPHGKVKGKTPLAVSVPPGEHEVWLAIEEQGVVTLTHGLVQVPDGGAVTVAHKNLKTEGLTPGWPKGPSAFRGASVRYQMDSQVNAWLSVDGGQLLALPSVPFELNLAPGAHTIVLYSDNVNKVVWDQGAVTLAEGQQAVVTCTTAGCIGFDQPPITIVNVHELPGFRLNVSVGVP